MKRPTVYLSGERSECRNYISAFLRVGFDPIFDDRDADALCLCGGGDVLPCLYGQITQSAKCVDLERDCRELLLIRKYMCRYKPVIAICRGMQVVNVYLGGTLIQNVSGHSQYRGKDVYHDVTLFGTLKDIYGGSACVNSAHHQAIDRLGEGLTVTAISDDGVIEGVESELLFACQFHPERLFGKTDGKKIFERFYEKYFT